MYSRTELLVGSKSMALLKSARVLIVGLGGVGGAATEMLARAGVGHLTLVDADTINASNINRQLIAHHEAVGKKKADEWRERLHRINPLLEITVHPVFIDETNTLQLLRSERFDFVVDAIDTVSPKVFLLKNCVEQGLRVVSSMGGGGKMDPSEVKMADISKTNYCALAKTVRTRLSKMGVKRGIPTVYSTEIVPRSAIVPTEGEHYKRSTTGTISYIPNLFGCWIAGYVIRELIKQC